MAKEIMYWMNLIVLGTIFYTSLAESYLWNLLQSDPETELDVAIFFNKHAFKIGCITTILSILPVIGQLYALVLSIVIIFLDDQKHVKGSYNDGEYTSLREAFVQAMRDDLGDE